MISELLRRNSILGWTALLHLGLFSLGWALSILSPGNPWLQPHNACLSIALYSATYAWIYYYADVSPGAKLLLSSLLAVTLFGVTVCLSIRADELASSLLLLNFVLALVGGIHMAQTTPTLALPPAYLWGIRLGIFLFALAGIQSGGVEFLNWTGEPKELRVAQFLGIHALQGLPLLGYLLGSVPAVWIAAAAWAAFTGWALLRG